MITVSHDMVTARKSHVCNFCCGKIEPKSQYYRSFHVANGSPYTWKSHVDCARLVTELNMDGDEGITQEIFYEDVQYKYHELTKGKGELREFHDILKFVINKTLQTYEHTRK